MSAKRTEFKFIRNLIFAYFLIWILCVLQRIHKIEKKKNNDWGQAKNSEPMQFVQLSKYSLAHNNYNVEHFVWIVFVVDRHNFYYFFCIEYSIYSKNAMLHIQVLCFFFASFIYLLFFYSYSSSSLQLTIKRIWDSSKNRNKIKTVIPAVQR